MELSMISQTFTLLKATYGDTLTPALVDLEAFLTAGDANQQYERAADLLTFMIVLLALQPQLRQSFGTHRAAITKWLDAAKKEGLQ